MKAVILAGGLGTRISEESVLRPKPMIEIGGKPILWHIMKLYSRHGINEFVICCGYKGYMIKEYFANYALHTSDVTVDVATGETTVHHRRAEPWKITMVDTGLETMTGGRLKRVYDYVKDGTFCMTYGDGVSDVDITGLIAYHKEHGKQATLTAIQPQARFGALTFGGESGAQITNFQEKPKGDGAWINGGFFVLEPEVCQMVNDDSVMWEHEPLKMLAAKGQLMAHKHGGFWQAMDTLRDRTQLEELWASGKAPWKTWSENAAQLTLLKKA